MDRIGPGTLLAGRYRLHERVHADPVSALWRADDVTLERPVAVRVLSTSHTRVEATLEAARRSALVADHRLQRVLGAGVEAGSGYVVLEWLTGQAVHRLAGQVADVEAARVLGEAAAGLESARRHGLTHCQLTPVAVIRASDGSIRVGGTGMDAAMNGVPSEGLERDATRDVRDLGALLYAVLTGRWPYGFAHGLLAAPTETGRPLRATAVDDSIDPRLAEICERAMAGSGPATAGQFAQQLASLGLGGRRPGLGSPLLVPDPAAGPVTELTGPLLGQAAVEVGATTGTGAADAASATSVTAGAEPAAGASVTAGADGADSGEDANSAKRTAGTEGACPVARVQGANEAVGVPQADGNRAGNGGGTGAGALTSAMPTSGTGTSGPGTGGAAAADSRDLDDTDVLPPLRDLPPPPRSTSSAAANGSVAPLLASRASVAVEHRNRERPGMLGATRHPGAVDLEVERDEQGSTTRIVALPDTAAAGSTVDGSESAPEADPPGPTGAPRMSTGRSPGQPEREAWPADPGAADATATWPAGQPYAAQSPAVTPRGDWGGGPDVTAPVPPVGGPAGVPYDDGWSLLPGQDQGGWYDGAYPAGYYEPEQPRPEYYEPGQQAYQREAPGYSDQGYGYPGAYGQAVAQGAEAAGLYAQGFDRPGPGAQGFGAPGYGTQPVQPGYDAAYPTQHSPVERSAVNQLDQQPAATGVLSAAGAPEPGAAGVLATPSSPLTVPAAGRSHQAQPSGSSTASRGTNLVVVLIVAAFVGAGLVWAVSAIRAGSDPEPAAEGPVVVTETSSAQPSAPAEPDAAAAAPTDGPRVITPAAVQPLDPGGDGAENDQDAPRAIDGDPSTSWGTQRYKSQQFGNLKDGVGLVFDLGSEETVVAVDVTAPGSGGQLELRTAADRSIEGSTVVAAGATGPAPASLVPESPVATRYLIVWFTSLPSNENEWRALVSEVQVQVQ